MKIDPRTLVDIIRSNTNPAAMGLKIHNLETSQNTMMSEYEVIKAITSVLNSIADDIDDHNNGRWIPPEERNLVTNL